MAVVLIVNTLTVNTWIVNMLIVNMLTLIVNMLIVNTLIVNTLIVNTLIVNLFIVNTSTQRSYHDAVVGRVMWDVLHAHRRCANATWRYEEPHTPGWGGVHHNRHNGCFENW